MTQGMNELEITNHTKMYYLPMRCHQDLFPISWVNTAAGDLGSTKRHDAPGIFVQTCDIRKGDNTRVKFRFNCVLETELHCTIFLTPDIYHRGDEDVNVHQYALKLQELDYTHKKRKETPAPVDDSVFTIETTDNEDGNYISHVNYCSIPF